MFGPGEYRPDPSEGITTPAELPPPELIRYHRSDTRHPCPRCGHSAYRDKQSSSHPTRFRQSRLVVSA